MDVVLATNQAAFPGQGLVPMTGQRIIGAQRGIEWTLETDTLCLKSKLSVSSSGRLLSIYCGVLRSELKISDAKDAFYPDLHS